MPHHNMPPQPAQANMVPSPNDPRVVDLITTPARDMDPQARADGYDMARNMSNMAPINGKLTVPYIRTYKDGQTRTEYRWGARYRDTFTFDGSVRGNFDEVPENRDDWSAGVQMMAMAGGEEKLGGKFTDAIFVMDDGEMVMVRRTRDTYGVMSAKDQKFEYIRTRAEENEVGSRENPRQITSDMLAGIAVAPGHPLLLGPDPNNGGKTPKTRNNVKAIFAVRLDEMDVAKAPADHPKAQPDVAVDVLGKFKEDLQRSRAANATGAVALAGAQLHP